MCFHIAACYFLGSRNNRDGGEGGGQLLLLSTCALAPPHSLPLTQTHMHTDSTMSTVEDLEGKIEVSAGEHLRSGGALGR